MQQLFPSPPLCGRNGETETAAADFLQERLGERPAQIPHLAAAMAGAPYLDRLFRNNTDSIRTILDDKPEKAIEKAHADLAQAMASTAESGDEPLMSAIRRFRQRINTTVSVSDLLDITPISKQLIWLSQAAETASALLADRLENQAKKSKRLHEDCRWCFIAMGKLGSSELNYSSDIDLIIIYDDPMKKDETGRVYVELTRRFVRIMSQATADGIGWRVDLRLRPNPSVTPIAISQSSAIKYYESLARTWERVAFIRARPIAGDKDFAERFLADIQPFIWRRYLDFSVIDDMQLMLVREDKPDDLYGYNVKKGEGGIRAIEFSTHVQQLIAGGREKDLRQRSTIPALDALAGKRWITDEEHDALVRHYHDLRRLEHRIQMVNDAHQHQLPRTSEAMHDLARLCGHEEIEGFVKAIHAVTDAVTKNSASVGLRLGAGDKAVAAEPDATEKLSLGLILDQDEDSNAVTNALASLGFSDAESIITVCRRWIAGQVPATQSERSREILVRILPRLLVQLGEAERPDMAFQAFARLVETLPFAVQLFSLLETNLNIAKVLATILIASPRMASDLADHPELVDNLLYEDFWQPFDRDIEAMAAMLASAMRGEAQYEDHLNILRVVVRSWRFRAGVHLVTGIIDSAEAGLILSAIAESAIRAALPVAMERVALKHGHIPDSAMLVMALGRLGANEMTTASDLDLVFIHEAPEDAVSDGDKPIYANQYFTRVGQELINVLTAPTGEGRAYEVDMRLRPSGKSGPVTIEFDRFADYQRKDAWTWEHMALIRARVVAGFNHQQLAEKTEACLADILLTPRDADTVTADMKQMRERIAASHPPRSGHDLRLNKGGLIDLDFFAQTNQLLHPSPDGKRHGRSLDAIAMLAERDIIPQQTAKTLMDSGQVLMELNQLIRLTMDDTHNQESEMHLPTPLRDRFNIETIADLDQLIATHTSNIAKAI